jgi:protein-tyrosine phosphatase
MNKILFVCMGNICRSPAAEAVFKKLIKTEGLEKKFFIDSAGTISFHTGSKADSRMILAAKKRNIEITSIARQLKKEDANNFDYIITMDDENYFDAMKITNNSLNILKMTDFLSNKYSNIKEIPDPYYGGEKGFEFVLDLLEDASINLLKFLKQIDNFK